MWRRPDGATIVSVQASAAPFITVTLVVVVGHPATLRRVADKGFVVVANHRGS
jgi:hypothetical protein